MAQTQIRITPKKYNRKKLNVVSFFTHLGIRIKVAAPVRFAMAEETVATSMAAQGSSKKKTVERSSSAHRTSP